MSELHPRAHLCQAPAEEGHQWQQAGWQSRHVQCSLSIQHIICEQLMAQQLGATRQVSNGGGHLGDVLGNVRQLQQTTADVKQQQRQKIWMIGYQPQASSQSTLIASLS